MKFLVRQLHAEIKRAARHFPALLLTGPRRVGKTTLLRRLFRGASYYLLEDPDLVARVRSDPRGFLDEITTPVILDEIQNAPELFSYVRTQVDRMPRRKGRWFLTGSQESDLMRGVSESMAGRVAVFHLLPLSLAETDKVSLFRGGFPEVLAQPTSASIWFRSYLQTYLERDVRAVTSVRDLATFRRFLALLAARCGQILNKTDLAAPLSVSVPTITEWLSILEITGQILLVPPFYENFGKRLIKSPKLYFVDSGLACHLLGIETAAELERSPFIGALFEGFVAAELVKHQINGGHKKELYYFRDQQGLEVDFLIPRGNGKLALVECKSSHTAKTDAATPIGRLMPSIRHYQVQGFVVYRPNRLSPATSVLAPGIKAVSLTELIDQL